MLAKSSSPVYLWYTRTLHASDLCYHLRLESDNSALASAPVEDGTADANRHLRSIKRGSADLEGAVASDDTAAIVSTSAALVEGGGGAEDISSVSGAHIEQRAGENVKGEERGDGGGGASAERVAIEPTCERWHRLEVDLNHEKWLSVEQNVSDTVRANSPWSDDATRAEIAQRKSPLFLSVGIGSK